MAAAGYPAHLRKRRARRRQGRSTRGDATQAVLLTVSAWIHSGAPPRPFFGFLHSEPLGGLRSRRVALCDPPPAARYCGGDVAGERGVGATWDRVAEPAGCRCLA